MNIVLTGFVVENKSYPASAVKRLFKGPRHITFGTGCEHAHCLQHHGERGHWASHFSSWVCLKIQPVAFVFWLHLSSDWDHVKQELYRVEWILKGNNNYNKKTLSTL